MTFQPDIFISWDISEKDNPTIIVTSIKYDHKAKNIIAEVLCRIDGLEANNGCISINQLMAKHHLYKSNKAKEEAEAALQKMQEGE